MFSNLLFLVFNLLIFANATDQTAWPLLPHEPGFALFISLTTYLLILLLIYVQNRMLIQSGLYQESIIFIDNLELLAFFSGFYFLIGGHRLLLTTFEPFGQTAALIFALTLYFGALLVCHASMQQKFKNTSSSAMPVRFLIPFALPFLFFIFLGEAQSLIPADFLSHLSTPFQIALMVFINLFVIALAIIFLPPLAVFLWNCPKLHDSLLTTELEALCKKANFSHAGLRLWSVMKNSCTAAIIGVIAPFRYILFTQKLLDLLPPRCIKAVVAHEIGHSRRYHLLLYPFVLLGMATLGSLALIPIYDNMSTGEDPGEQAVMQFFTFFLFAAVVAIYFRFIFGYFSRLFEREADLNIFELGIPAQDMVDALDMLAISSGNIHDKPNWHHHSIRDRINFLEAADKNPALIKLHHRKILYSLLVYSLILIPILIYLVARIANMG